MSGDNDKTSYWSDESEKSIFDWWYGSHDDDDGHHDDDYDDDHHHDHDHDHDCDDDDTPPAPVLDGIVEGTAGADLIDAAYTGDPQGDRIDNSDAIQTGAGPQDDIVIAGAGNDTVLAGEGDDLVYGGSGNDVINGASGDDTLIGGTGSDTVSGGSGDDLIIGGGDNAPDLEAITFKTEEADFENTIGVYQIDPETGQISNVQIVFANASLAGSGGTLAGGETAAYAVPQGAQIGVFQVANGNNLNDFAALGEGSYAFVNADGSPAGIGDSAPILVHVAPDGTQTTLSGDVFHSAGFDDNTALNPDGKVHVKGISDNGDGSFTIGFEDLNGLGDKDFNDSVITVGLAPGTSLLTPGLDASVPDDGSNPGEDGQPDVLDGGTGDDTIIGGAGSDSVTGGAGNDVIDTAGPDPLPDLGFAPVPADADPEDDRDFVDGGADNDRITTGDDRDTILGGDGNDTIDAGIDADLIDGGAGDDLIIGSEGSDTIEGGAGNDTIYGGLDPAFPDSINIPDATDPVPDNGRDVIDGGSGNDLIFGQDDDDTILGGEGDDTIDAGIDDDLVEGGAGNDVITGGAGIDTLLGSDDRDTFLGANPGDQIDGGEGGDDHDTLDLRGSGPLRVILNGDNPENGMVEFLDGDRNVTGTATFQNIEEIVPCFTPGTVIATPQGEKRVEDLVVGDRVVTRDNGLQEIRWIGHKPMDWRDLAANPHLKPVLIQKGALGNGLPERDMLVSPNHRMLVANERTALYFEEHEVLVAAKHLINHRGVHEVDSMGTTYIHFMFDRHEVVLANGAWTESFQPGDYSLKGMGNAQRSEIFELFPDLKTTKGREAYGSVRKTLKRFEAQLLRS
jgi:Ca2+-binding RTX toxin-like protein